MNNSINNVILFVCSNSNASIEPVNLVKYYQIPVQIVKLDTQKARNKAKKGKYFQITSVPSLVVMYQDGTLQMFIGKDKIVNWIQQLITSKTQPPTKPTYDQTEDYETTLYESPPKKNKKEKKGKKHRKKKHSKPKNLEYLSSSEDEDEDFIIVETYEDDINNNNIPDPYTSGLSIHQTNNRRDKITDVKRIAEQMKKERERTCMYADIKDTQ